MTDDCLCGELPRSTEEQEFGPGLCAFCAALKYRKERDELQAKYDDIWMRPSTPDEKDDLINRLREENEHLKGANETLTRMSQRSDAENVRVAELEKIALRVAGADQVWMLNEIKVQGAPSLYIQDAARAALKKGEDCTCLDQRTNSDGTVRELHMSDCEGQDDA